MKVKLTILTLLCSLINNVTAGELSGNISTGYKSDYIYRGALVSSEAIQTQLGVEGHVSGKVGAYFNGFMSSPLAGTSDTYEFIGGVSSSFLDGLLAATGGYTHREQVDGASVGELFVGLSADVVLSPTVTVFYNLDDELYTTELGVSHTFDTELAALTVGVGVGRTEVTKTLDRDYFIAGLGASRVIVGNLKGNLGVDYIDAEDVDEETVVSVGLSLDF
jgi:hypothetical protein